MIVWKLALSLSVIGAVTTTPTVKDVPSGAFSRMPDGSLTFTAPDYDSATQVDIHYNINKPLHGVTAGDFNDNIITKTNGAWVHTNTKVTVKPGDVINYWVLFITPKGGFQNTDLSTTIQADTTTTTTTTSTTTESTTASSTTPHSTTSSAPSNQTTTPGPSTTAGTTPAGGQTTPSPSPDKCTSYPCVIFEDEFDTLDMDKWEHEITAGGGGNWEFEVYVNNRSNSWVNDSKLHIRPTLTSDVHGEQFLSNGLLDIWGNTPASQCTGPQFYGCFRQGTGVNYINPVQSARIRTAKSFSFRYGRVETEAKMPKGDWLWPAIWMLPKREHYGLWPASGEIDIVESRGNADYKDANGKSFGTEWMASTMHWGPYYGQNAYLKTHVEKNSKSGTFASDFHKYAVEWDDSKIVFYLDDEEIMTVDPGKGGFWELGEFDKNAPGSFNPWLSDGTHMAPFDREFYLIINLAVGGTNGFFPDTAVNGGYPKPWNDLSQTAPRDFWNAKNSWYPTWKFPDDTLQVKYIRVTKLKPDQ